MAALISLTSVGREPTFLVLTLRSAQTTEKMTLVHSLCLTPRVSWPDLLVHSDVWLLGKFQ